LKVIKVNETLTSKDMTVVSVHRCMCMHSDNQVKWSLK